MGIIDIILNPLVWIIFFESMTLVTVLVITLRSPTARTFIKLATPFLARGMVLTSQFNPQKRSVNFSLAKTEKDRLMKYSEKRKGWMNKTIEKDTYYIDAGTGSPYYVTVEGDTKTIDPVKGVDPTRFDDIMAKNLIQYGEEIQEYFKGMDDEPEKVLGMTTGQLALIVVLMLFGVLAAMWMFSIGMADLAARVGGA